MRHYLRTLFIPGLLLAATGIFGSGCAFGPGPAGPLEQIRGWESEIDQNVVAISGGGECPDRCRAAESICDCAERICQVARDLAELDALESCHRAEEHCHEAQRRVAESCTCE